MTKNNRHIEDVIGKLPYRLALAGGWIDQPFVSMHNPSPPGSMVVVSVEPQFRFIERTGICTSTRKIALKLWKDGLPRKNLHELVKKRFDAENRGKKELSGSQDMIGIIYPGINRLDYDFTYRKGVFPRYIESCNDPQIAGCLEKVIHILQVAPRPEGYNPLETKNLSPECISRLGKSGRNCYEAIIAKDVDALGASMNECMSCWKKILSSTVRHHKLNEDLLPLLEYCRSNYPGAMYSGGGYLFVASRKPVPGAFHIKVRIKKINMRIYMKKTFKRYCKFLQLKNDPKLIEEYKKIHAMGASWPEITEGMKQVGIIDMEIYIAGTNLFMIMDTRVDFDHEKAMAQLAKLPRQAEWEALVSKYQETNHDATAGEKWRVLERTFKMDKKPMKMTTLNR